MVHDHGKFGVRSLVEERTEQHLLFLRVLEPNRRRKTRLFIAERKGYYFWIYQGPMTQLP